MGFFLFFVFIAWLIYCSYRIDVIDLSKTQSEDDQDLVSHELFMKISESKERHRKIKSLVFEEGE